MMKLKKFSNPFDGQEINVAQFEDNSFVFDMAFSHESIPVAYNEELDCYAIPARCFKYVHTLSLQETAEVLDVSKMRVSALCSKGQLRHTKVNGIIRIEYDSILEYQEVRDMKKGYERLENDPA